MQPIKKVLTLPPIDYYRKHLEVINALLPVRLTEKELDVLAAFLNMDPMLTEDGRFNTVTRRKVREALKLSPGGLSNHLGSMLEKGFLSKSEISSKITIKDFLVPEEGFQGYMIRINKKVV